MDRLKSNIGRRYDWIPDLPDHRDDVYQVKRRLALPTKVDLSAKCSPVEDQGDLGSCTANALAGALEFLEDVDGTPFKDISRLFIYYGERAIEHTINQDSGAQIRDGVKFLHQIGVCSEDLWPYVIAKFKQRPPAAAYADASGRKITSYSRVIGINALRACLAAGFPVVFGFTVYDGFESDAVARTGKLNMPKPTERALGGHAVLAVGYDDGTKRVKVRNSWGAGWGLKGYFTMPYDYIGNPQLADDFWTIRAGSQL
ncbi:MAG TPA: C1 family peptidase [Dongiaceae bacterium]|nr:C1 family peptidase [Dongiaceae bacterium]